MGHAKLLFLLLIPVAVFATEFYKLPNTKRIDQDLYRSGDLIIETRYCYHYTYGETAILKYEGSGEFSGSKIIWQDDDQPCEVKGVYSK